MSYTDFENKPAENVARGTLLTLLVIPVGVVVWLLIWNFGFVAGIVTYGVALLAVVLYKLGAGFVSRAGAVRVTVITLITIALSLFAGLVSDVAVFVGKELGISQFAAVLEPDFWPFFTDVMFTQGAIEEYAPQLLIAVGIGLLGCFSILRNAFKATAPEPAPSPYDATVEPAVPAAPVAPAAAPSPYDSLYTNPAPTQTTPILNPESTGIPAVPPTDEAPTAKR